MRSGAQLFSYELSLLLCLLLVVMASGTGSLRGVVESQRGGIWDWWILKLPGAGALAFLLFLVSSTAELNRGPLDLSEAESELTGGFHTEYTGIAFSLFFLAEYINLFAASALGTTFFLGGYLPPSFGIPYLDPALAAVPGTVWFLLKAYGLIFIYMWFRWTFPRLRIDHLLALEWKCLLPASLGNLLFGATLVALGWMLP
jgi:NADH-quinone oxidoreductase subunit H